MKTSTSVALFAIFLVYGMFGIIHYDSYAVKTAAGYDWWLYSGIVSLVLAVIIGVSGFLGQNKK